MALMAASLTVVIITLNEESNIVECINIGCG